MEKAMEGLFQKPKGRFLGSIVEAQRFDRETLDNIFKITSSMEELVKRNACEPILEGKIMVSLFYEASTRTRLSFESAMTRLGGKVIGTENAKEFSSKAKGESLEDTIKVVSGYGDVIVLRYYKKGGAKRAQRFSRVPIINAGDGNGQHPTQALLDLYTIKKVFGEIKGLNIGLVGDLANGRTVRSLCYFLAKHFPGNKIFLVSPKEVRMKKDIKDYLNKYQVVWEEVEAKDILEIVGDLDVFYQTRVQQERFGDDRKKLEKVKREALHLIINGKITRRMKKNAIIMHPLPRNEEICYSVDKNIRAKYFEQADNGLYIRMALLSMILFGY